ncbi:A-kinase anchor protein 12, partial [Xiphias gladius]|uniref:A-kinase anchor protein 12 n=1 Tax=Xiphias gladius TaxID=8245 RepID=UPI001A992294
MGDAQSAQRESKNDAAAEEESGKVDDARPGQDTSDKPLSNNGQISEVSGNADSTIAEVNCHCEEEITAEAFLSPDEEVSETTKPPREDEIPVENVENNEEESPNDVDVNEDLAREMTEMDAKQNDINESFKRFFSNIGLKLTVKRGSAGKAELEKDVLDETNEEESNRSEDVGNTAKETKSENAEQNIDLNAAQETYDNDSTTCPTLTDVTSEDVLEHPEEKTTEAKEEVESDHVDAATTSPVDEDIKAQQDATLEEDLHPTSPSSSEAEMVVSPIKRFFTTGIFSGLRKKKRSIDDELIEKELLEFGKKETVETTEKNVEVQQDKEATSPCVEAAAVEAEHEEDELKEEILSAASAPMTDDGKSPPTDPATITVNEPEMMSSQEKVQASPLKMLLSGSSIKKLSKKQRGRKSSDTKLSDSGEHFSDQLMSSTESDEKRKEESPTQHSEEAAGDEDGAWASFKKLVTPKKRKKRSSLTNEETQIPGSVEETKPSEGEQISDRSTDEGKKRKDSSVSWEAVLCGSGRRSRGRKTSDSEDEMPQAEHDSKKQESPLESSNEVSLISSFSPKQAGSPSEGDGGSTWKSFKKLVTPKRKAKDEEESKDNIESDTEVTQDDSSFSIKKLLPGQKKRKSAEKQDQVSSDEADKEVVSGDEDFETPAVVPLSEFDTIETGVHIKKQADVESHVPKEADYELQQDLLEQMAEPVQSCDSPQTEADRVQDNQDTLENEASTAPASNEEPEDVTELISKHQQLSDIPEEGIITETIATPTSVTEEAARDDTIAEDLIEITSEAITAPEPVDITLADETEMISAVSQLSESSKTSGNTTPVPAEYDAKDTMELLQQAVETISIIPKAVPVCSDEVNSERIIGSVSHQILESFVKEQTKILEIHRRSDTTAFNTGLNVEELDVINEFTATAQTENISEVNEAVSTEIVSEVPTEVFDEAEIAVDEVHDVNISNPEGSTKEIESTDESQHMVGSQSEVNEAVSIETLPQGEEIVADEGSLVGAHQDEKEPLKIDFQEAESVATIAEESKDGGVQQEVQTQTQKEDQILLNITDQVQVEDKDQPVVEVEELQELAAVTSDSEEGSVQSLEKEVVSKALPEAETVTDEPKEETEPLTAVSESVDAFETEHVQEPEILEASQVIKLDSEQGSVQSLEKEVVSKALPEAETVTDEPKEETEPLTAVSEPVDAFETEHVQEPEILEASQVIKLDSEQDYVPITHEPKHEVHLSAVQASVEGEKVGELSGAEIRSAAVEHCKGAQVIKCYPKDVSAVISDVLIEKTSEIHEPLLDSVANEQEFKETIETAIPLVKDVTQTAEGGSAVMMMNVPSIQFEDNHRIQVQLVDVDIKSAETIVDTALEVGVTEAKVVRDVCHETNKDVDKFSATLETEEKLTNKENKVTIQEVIQNVKVNLPETLPESVLVNLEQEVIKQTDAVTEASEIPESELSEVEDQKVMEDSIGTFRERGDEAYAVISDDSATEQQVFEDLRKTSDIPGSSVLIPDRKEDLEEPKAKLEESEADVTTEEVKLSSDDLDVKKIKEEAQLPQIAQSEIVTPSNTGSVVPQNTGIISSIGNVESPSSLSLEFKLNIQFGQAKATASPPPTPERIEPVKKTVVSEVGVQAEPKKQTNPTQSAESQKQTELTEVAVQAPKIVKPEPVNLDTTERAGIMNQPVLLDVGMAAIVTVDPVEQIKSTEKVTPNIQVTQTIQTVRQREKREVFLSQPVISEACDQETKAEEPVEQTEEEMDPDVWMDAEENIYAKEATEVS